MDKITQTVRFRQALIEYAGNHGVTKAAIRYRTNRQYVYRWIRRYDGTIESLKDRSHRPKSHPKQHREEEIKLIEDLRRRNPHLGLVVFWVKLRNRGYTRSISGLYRFLRKRGQMAVKPPNPKYTPKKYKEADYPGQKVQIDVKFVPKSCLVGKALEQAKENGGYFYQYTFIDEYSRFRILEAFEEHNTYSSTQFLMHCIERFPYVIECVQTDNGPEFTNRFISQCSNKPTLFETTLSNLGIKHQLIRPFTPRHNGKVERSHRKDNEYFYAVHAFYSFCDFKRQLEVWNRKYNNFPMRPLGWSSPKQALYSFHSPSASPPRF